MIVVDACVWVSLFLQEDSHYAEADRWFRQVEEQRITLCSPTIMLAETAGALSRRTGSIDLALRTVQTMNRLSTVQIVPIDDLLGLQAARLAAQLQLRGADACYVAVAQELDLPLVTWDEELLSRAAGVVAVLRPE